MTATAGFGIACVVGAHIGVVARTLVGHAVAVVVLAVAEIRTADRARARTLRLAGRRQGLARQDRCATGGLASQACEARQTAGPARCPAKGRQPLVGEANAGRSTRGGRLAGRAGKYRRHGVLVRQVRIGVRRNISGIQDSLSVRVGTGIGVGVGLGVGVGVGLGVGFGIGIGVGVGSGSGSGFGFGFGLGLGIDCRDPSLDFFD